MMTWFVPFVKLLFCVSPKIPWIKQTNCLVDYSSSLPTYWQSDNQMVDNNGSNDQHDWLRELADIATGPHSPLLQNKPDNNQELVYIPKFKTGRYSIVMSRLNLNFRLLWLPGLNQKLAFNTLVLLHLCVIVCSIHSLFSFVFFFFFFIVDIFGLQTRLTVCAS